MDGKHLVVTCTLSTEDQVIQTHALIDGATVIKTLELW